MEELLDARGLNEEQAIARYRAKNSPKPAMTADIVILRRENGKIKVLLVRRGGHPYLGKWALPGGFAEQTENIWQTAARELEEETGVSGMKLEMVDVFSEPGRDPRGWTVSVAFCSVLDEDVPVKAGDDAADAAWFEIRQQDGKILLQNGETTLDTLAFDHMDILAAALSKTEDR